MAKHESDPLECAIVLVAALIALAMMATGGGDSKKALSSRVAALEAEVAALKGAKP